jgi:hypothetical protein
MRDGWYCGRGIHWGLVGLLEEFLLDLVIGYGGSKGEGPNSMPSGFPCLHCITIRRSVILYRKVTCHGRSYLSFVSEMCCGWSRTLPCFFGLPRVQGGWAGEMSKSQ